MAGLRVCQHSSFSCNLYLKQDFVRWIAVWKKFVTMSSFEFVFWWYFGGLNLWRAVNIDYCAWVVLSILTTHSKFVFDWQSYSSGKSASQRSHLSKQSVRSCRPRKYFVNLSRHIDSSRFSLVIERSPFTIVHRTKPPVSINETQSSVESCSTKFCRPAVCRPHTTTVAFVYYLFVRRIHRSQLSIMTLCLSFMLMQ